MTLHSVSPTALDGFEISDIVKDSVRSIEERCNIFSIIGSSVLRYGSHIPNPPLPPTSTKEQKANRPSTTPNRKKNATRNRAQTAAAVSNSQQLSSTGPIKLVSIILVYFCLFFMSLFFLIHFVS